MRCLRCNREFDNPIPKITNPKGITEIACKDWCPKCNAIAMSMVYRGGSAYLIEKGTKLRDTEVDI